MGRSTRLTLLCRGATPSSRAAAFWSDEPLEPGQEQKLAAVVQGLGRIDAVACSPEISTRQTASAFASTPDIVTDLRDIDYGTWRKRTFAEIVEADTPSLSRWFDDPTSAPHGGEPYAAAARRVHAWIDAQHGFGGHRLAVVHPVIIKLAVLCVLSAPLQSLRHVDVGFLTATRFSSDGVRWTIRPSA